MLVRNLQHLEDLPACNELFAGKGKGIVSENQDDLVIRQRATPLPITMADAYDGGNNFGPSLQIWTGEVERDPNDPVYRSPQISGITRDELMDVIDGGSPEGLGPRGTHLHTPAFHRAAILDPDFFIDLTVAASSPEYVNPEALRPDMFVALGIMQQLVDVRDPGRHYGAE